MSNRFVIVNRHDDFFMGWKEAGGHLVSTWSTDWHDAFKSGHIVAVHIASLIEDATTEIVELVEE